MSFWGAIRGLPRPYHYWKRGTTDPNKIQAIVEWPIPTSLTALHAFLGLTGFYRHFLKDCAAIASPIIELRRSTTFS